MSHIFHPIPCQGVTMTGYIYSDMITLYTSLPWYYNRLAGVALSC